VIDIEQLIDDVCARVYEGQVPAPGEHTDDDLDREYEGMAKFVAQIVTAYGDDEALEILDRARRYVVNNAS
jgi:hypothetical protein